MMNDTLINVIVTSSLLNLLQKAQDSRISGTYTFDNLIMLAFYVFAMYTST